MGSEQQNPPTRGDEIARILESVPPDSPDTEAATIAGRQLGQLFEGVKQRAEADVAAARAAQHQAEAEAARAKERAASAVQFKDDEARRHAEELRRLETAYEARAEALTAASAAHQARAERAEAEAARLREEPGGR